jgi:hypothetical protein
LGAGESWRAAAGVFGSCVFADAVPAVINIVGALGAYGFDDAAAEGIVGVFDGRSCCYDFDEAVFTIVGEGSIGSRIDGEWIGSGVAVVVVGRVYILHRRVLIEGVGDVSRACGTSSAR